MRFHKFEASNLSVKLFSECKNKNLFIYIVILSIECINRYDCLFATIANSFKIE